MPETDRYLSIVEAPLANSRLVTMRPLAYAQDAGLKLLRPEQLGAEFPNLGRITWSRYTDEPKLGALWWHRTQQNPGYISGLRGSNRWLVDESDVGASPREAVELLDLRERFETDDRQLRADLLYNGIPFSWRPTRQVYLCIGAANVWIGPLALVAVPAQAMSSCWRIAAVPQGDTVSLPAQVAPPDADLFHAVLDGHKRTLVAPQARPGTRLPDWLWPTDAAALRWLADELDALGASDVDSREITLRHILTWAAERAQNNPVSVHWLPWAERAINRLDQHDQTIASLIDRLMAAPAIIERLPPPPDPNATQQAIAQARRAGYVEGYGAARAETEHIAATVQEEHARKLAAADARIAQVRRELQAAQEDFDATRDALDEARTDASLVRGRLATVEHAFEQAQATLTQTRGDLVAAQQSKESLRGQLEASQAAMQAHEADAVLARARIAELEAELARMESGPPPDPDALRQALEREEALRSELGNAWIAARELRDERDAHERKLKEAREEHTRLRAASKRLHAQIEQLEQRPAPPEDLTQVHTKLDELLDHITILQMGRLSATPTSDIPAWRSPWADRPAPQSIIAESVIQEFRRSLRDAQLPGALAPTIWKALQAGRMPILAGYGARDILAILADQVFGGRRLSIEVDPGLLAPADLLGTLHNGRLRPSASRFADLLLHETTSPRPETDAPVLAALYGLTRAPVDAYLLPLLEHYARPAWISGSGEQLQPLLPATLDVSDPYAPLAERHWPRTVRIAATIEPGAATVPPPTELWAHAVFFCLDHATPTTVPGRPTVAVARASAELGQSAELEQRADTVTNGQPEHHRPASSVRLADLHPGGGLERQPAAERRLADAMELLAPADVHIPERVQQAAIVLGVREFTRHDLLSGLLLPCAITAGADRTELARLLLSSVDEDGGANTDERLIDCLGCMEQLFR